MDITCNGVSIFVGKGKNMKYIEVINLSKYQHYQTGRPTVWIKWYLKSLNDYKFQQLKDRERWIFVGIIMLAVSNGNSIPLDYHYLYHSLCFRGSEGGGAGVSGVVVAIEKMAKLRLLCIKNASIDKIRKEKRRDDSNNLKNDDDVSYKMNELRKSLSLKGIVRVK
jgi:hypothetical protein